LLFILVLPLSGTFGKYGEGQVLWKVMELDAPYEVILAEFLTSLPLPDSAKLLEKREA
jgi:hypothetical protein